MLLFRFNHLLASFRTRDTGEERHSMKLEGNLFDTVTSVAAYYISLRLAGALTALSSDSCPTATKAATAANTRRGVHHPEFSLFFFSTRNLVLGQPKFRIKWLFSPSSIPQETTQKSFSFPENEVKAVGSLVVEIMLGEKVASKGRNGKSGL